MFHVLTSADGVTFVRGDRVVVKTKEGEVAAKQLVRSSALKIEFRPVNRPETDLSLEASQLAWMSRIIWASQ